MKVETIVLYGTAGSKVVINADDARMRDRFERLGYSASPPSKPTPRPGSSANAVVAPTSSAVPRASEVEPSPNLEEGSASASPEELLTTAMALTDKAEIHRFAAEELGMELDGRWSVDRVRTEIRIHLGL